MIDKREAALVWFSVISKALAILSFVSLLLTATPFIGWNVLNFTDLDFIGMLCTYSAGMLLLMLQVPGFLSEDEDWVSQI
jgi:hypothetical protein